MYHRSVDAQFDADVTRAQQVYAQLAPWIDKYHGGLPAGVLAAFITHESNGQFNAPGDASLGEVGYLQVAAYVPPLFGYDADARLDPESNIAIGVLEYGLEAVLWSIEVPEVNLGSSDSWKLARLSFAVGRAGSRQLAQLAAATIGLIAGDVYGSIVRYVLASGGVPLGSQSAAKVAQRVLDISRQWDIGQAVRPGLAGPPVRIPAPPAGPYTLPALAEPFFVNPISGTMLIIAGMAALAYLMYTR